MTTATATRHAIRYDHPQAGTLYLASYGWGATGLRCRFDPRPTEARTFKTAGLAEVQRSSLVEFLADGAGGAAESFDAILSVVRLS
jgi:hypothetical protein